MNDDLPLVPLAPGPIPNLDDVLIQAIKILRHNHHSEIAEQAADHINLIRRRIVGRPRVRAGTVANMLADLHCELPAGDVRHLVAVAYTAAVMKAEDRPESRRPSTLMLAMAVRVLPWPDRARYFEEFRAELADLPRLSQVVYGIRLVVRSVGLRRALRQEGERGAQPAVNS